MWCLYSQVKQRTTLQTNHSSSLNILRWISAHQVDFGVWMCHNEFLHNFRRTISKRILTHLSMSGNKQSRKIPKKHSTDSILKPQSECVYFYAINAISHFRIASDLSTLKYVDFWFSLWKKNSIQTNVFHSTRFHMCNIGVLRIDFILRRYSIIENWYASGILVFGVSCCIKVPFQIDCIRNGTSEN